MACKWILLIPPSCNPVMQPLQSGSIYNQPTALQQQQHSLQQLSNFQQFQQPQQFNIQSIKRSSVPRAYPLTQLPPPYRGNLRVPPFKEYKPNNNFPGRVLKIFLSQKESVKIVNFIITTSQDRNISIFLQLKFKAP